MLSNLEKILLSLLNPILTSFHKNLIQSNPIVSSKPTVFVLKRRLVQREKILQFCWECGAKFEKEAKYCSECGKALDPNINRTNLDFLGDKKQFIIRFNFEDPKGTGSIVDLDMNTLVDFEYKYTHKPPYRAGLRAGKWAKGWTTGWAKGWVIDFRLLARDEALVGEIRGFLPPLFSPTLRYVWEIYNSKNELKGKVWEKLRGLSKSGSDWILENPERKVIATFQGDRENKNYYIMNESNEIVARCYKSSDISNTAHRVDILGSELDTFLILCYILVLDRAERYPIIKFF